MNLFIRVHHLSESSIAPSLRHHPPRHHPPRLFYITISIPISISQTSDPTSQHNQSNLSKHPPSILTYVHSLRRSTRLCRIPQLLSFTLRQSSLAAGRSPLWSIERSSAVGGRNPPYNRLGGGTPQGETANKNNINKPQTVIIINKQFEKLISASEPSNSRRRRATVEPLLLSLGISTPSSSVT